MDSCYQTLPETPSNGNISRIDEHYEYMDKIGRGAYGIVHKMRDKRTGEVVAVKEEIDGMSLTTIREIYVLDSLPRHPSIVEHRRVIKDDSNRVFVEMEYIENDLSRFLKIRKKKKNPLTVGEAKFALKRILEGVKFLHGNGVMLRDLKPSNILISNDMARLKICDFGLSRRMDRKSGRYTPEVVTLEYRAPELLVGLDSYSSAIDMWSAGCIMAELLLNESLFEGDSEIAVLSCIHEIVGAYVLRKKFPARIVTASGYDLLKRLLCLNPHKRITAEASLNHNWFRED